MPFVNLNTVTVTGTFLMFDESIAQGTVTFDAPSALLAVSDAAGDQIIVPKSLTVTLDVDGHFSIDLPATDDPDVNPTGFTYHVTEKIVGGHGPREYDIEIPWDDVDNTIDLADIAPSVPLDAVSSYVLLATFNALETRVVALEAGGGGSSSFELDMRDFGLFDDPTLSVDQHQAFVDAFAELDVNRGGRIVVPVYRVYIATGLVCTIQGLELVGEGQTGVSDELAKGSTQIVVGDGQWGMTLGSVSATKFRGFRISNLHFYEKNAGQALGGLRLLRCSDSYLDRVAAGRFTAGVGIMLDGTGDNAQYNTLIDCRVGKCLIGYHQKAANGTRLISFYAEGATNGGNPGTGTLGLKLESGDSLSGHGVVVQGYDTLVEIGGNIGHAFYGLRCESWRTQAVHVLNNARRCKIHGMGDNVLAGNLGAGVVIDAGAQDTEDYMTIENVSLPSLRHVDSGTRTRFPTLGGAPAQASVLGTVTGKKREYNPDGTFAGYSPLYDNITGISRVRKLGGVDPGTTGITTVTRTLPAGTVPVGDFVLITGGYGNLSTVTVTCADSKGNTYTVDRHDDMTTGATPHSFVISAPVTTALSAGDTITVTFSSTVSYPIIHCYQYTGILPAAYVDLVDGDIGTSTTPTSGAMITSADYDLILVAVYHASTAPTMTPGAGYTLLDTNTSTAKTLDTEDRLVGVAGSYAADGILASSVAWTLSAVAYKKA